MRRAHTGRQGRYRRRWDDGEKERWVKMGGSIKQRKWRQTEVEREGKGKRERTKFQK